MTRVEFRFLQYVVSQVSDDRITVGLLHWDGRALRFAHSTSRLPAGLTVHRRALDRELKAMAREVRKLKNDSGNLLALTDVYRVTEGRGASLLWAPVRVGKTKDAEAHFAELSGMAGLTGEGRREGGKAIRELKESLEELGHALEKRTPGRIRTKMRVTRRPATDEHAYVSPLSWKNGKWHHTVPLNFAKAPTEMAREAYWVMGLLQLAIPEADKAVILAMLPHDRDLARRARAEAAVLRDAGGSRVDVLTAAARDRGKVLKELGHRIEHEVSSDAED